MNSLFQVTQGDVIIGQWCGLQHFSTLRIKGNHVTVKFVSNTNKNVYRGFRMVYGAVNE